MEGGVEVEVVVAKKKKEREGRERERGLVLEGCLFAGGPGGKAI